MTHIVDIALDWQLSDLLLFWNIEAFKYVPIFEYDEFYLDAFIWINFGEHIWFLSKKPVWWKKKKYSWMVLEQHISVQMFANGLATDMVTIEWVDAAW